MRSALLTSLLLAACLALAGCISVAPAALAAAAPAPSAPHAAAPAAALPTRSAILISCDGLDRDVLKPMLVAGKLPAFSALAARGSFRAVDVRGYETATMPAHAAMLTGLTPDLTGVSSNISDVAIPAGYTLFARLKAHYPAASLATLLVAAKYDKFAVDGATSPYYHARNVVDVHDVSWRRADRITTDALAALDRVRDRRFFAFVHFVDPDEAGHLAGRGSALYARSAVRCDAALARIDAWVEQRGLRGSTSIYVTADHGFNTTGTSHSNAPHVFLVTDDTTVTRGGSSLDVPATVLARLGVAVESLKPPLAGTPLTGD